MGGRSIRDNAQAESNVNAEAARDTLCLEIIMAGRASRPGNEEIEEVRRYLVMKATNLLDHNRRVGQNPLPVVFVLVCKFAIR